VVARLRRTEPVEVRDMQFLRSNTAFAAAVNAEALDLQAAGADVIQLDEPWLRNDPQAAGRYAVRAINRALEGITVPTVVHLCFGYAAVAPGQKPSGYSFLPGIAA
jgi:5-methyltetrahydropteroyltriglutamate--homocysteine methyltransferase